MPRLNYLCQGCGSDANPIPRHRPGLAQMYGQVLAYAVDDALRDKTQQSAWLRGPLRCSMEVASLPFDPEYMPSQHDLEQRANSLTNTQREQRAAQHQLDILARNGQLQSAAPFPAQVWGFGPAASELVMVVLTGEVVSDYSVRFKQIHGWERTWVAAYANELLSCE
jgi:hypothetical protein